MLREIVRAFARNWWLILIRGIVAILFGLVAILWPDLTVTALVILLGAFALVPGAPPPPPPPPPPLPRPPPLPPLRPRLAPGGRGGAVSPFPPRAPLPCFFFFFFWGGGGGGSPPILCLYFVQ